MQTVVGRRHHSIITSHLHYSSTVLLPFSTHSSCRRFYFVLTVITKITDTTIFRCFCHPLQPPTESAARFCQVPFICIQKCSLENWSRVIVLPFYTGRRRLFWHFFPAPFFHFFCRVFVLFVICVSLTTMIIIISDVRLCTSKCM